jgi:ATP-binding cassette subfamily F protein 3
MLLDTNFLILDEPTNHLDVKTKDIFQKALINYSGTVAIVSHDRYFLDHLVNKVFEIKDGFINDYSGNYTYFIEKRSESINQSRDDSTSPASSKEQAVTNKDKKRLEAEERNKLSKIKNTWKKELSVVEEKIELLEARKSGNEATLCDPQTHKDSAKIKELQIELKDITTALENYYNIWTDISSKLEKLSIANADIVIGQ